MKLLTPAEKALVRKDFGDLWNEKTTRGVLIFVPLLTAVALPLFFLALLLNTPLQQMNGVDQMMRLLPAQASQLNPRQGMFYLAVNLVCPMFYLMVPIMASCVSAACSFAGERERGTLESLLLTPMNVRKIVKAKTLGCMFLSAVTTVLSFLLFAVVVSIGDIVLGMPFFLNWNWLVLLFFASPSLTIFGVVFMAFLSSKNGSYAESVQTSGYLILPVALLFLGQLTGLFQVGAVLLLIISCVLLAIDAVLWFLVFRFSTPEKLLR